MELRSRYRSFLLGTFILLALTVMTHKAAAQDQDVVLLLNAIVQENKACLVLTIPEPTWTTNCNTPVPGLFVRKGRRTELRVFNRKFMTDYSITVDAVTELQSGPNIRNLNEAENISFSAPSFATAPPSKGGAEGLSYRTEMSIFSALLDESTVGKPREDLVAEKAVVDRERANIQREIDAFNQGYGSIWGDAGGAIVCGTLAGGPDVVTLQTCLNQEMSFVSVPGPLPIAAAPNPNFVLAPFTNEQAFREELVQIQDLVGYIKTFSDTLTSSDLVSREQKIESDVVQYEHDRLVFEANYRASLDAVELVRRLARGDRFRTGLRREQLKLQLKALQSDPKASIDEAELNELLDEYERSLGNAAVRRVLTDKWEELCRIVDGYLIGEPPVGEFQAVIQANRQLLGVVLPGAIDDINARQGRLLTRINYIYDHSEVREALPKQIDIGKHPGNLIVYYTIRRIESFQRFTVKQVSGPGAGGQANPMAPPPAKSAAPAGSPSSTATAGNGGTDNGGGDQTKPQEPPGVVVARGSFEVHEFFHATVVAAYAFSTLKDQSIAKQAAPNGCGATPGSPDANCFTPILNSKNRQQQVFVGLAWYLKPRDTFPSNDIYCKHALQCVGPLGAVSVNNAGSFFLGAFVEPLLGLQISGGANLGSERTLQKNYQFNVPADVSGDFPTYQRRATGGYFSIGLDLGIFRRVFGKVTGIGTAGSTQGS